MWAGFDVLVWIHLCIVLSILFFLPGEGEEEARRMEFVLLTLIAFSVFVAKVLLL